jgi:hypothetical protein
MKYREAISVFEACHPPFDSTCYHLAVSGFVLDSEACAVASTKRYNATDPTIVSQLAEVNVEIDAACGQLKTKVHHPPMC